MCPVHGIPLEDRCSRCMAGARCRFRAVDGLLRLACTGCERLVDPAPHSAVNDTSMGAFGVCLTPALIRLAGQLQGDLQAALAGIQPKRPWGFVRSADGLNTVVRNLTFCIVMATRVKCELRIELPDPKARISVSDHL